MVAASGRRRRTAQVSGVAVDELRATARNLDEGLLFAAAFSSPTYQAGYIRFLPGRRGKRTIVHEDQDVVCLVLTGRGRLAHGRRVSEVHPGEVWRVPAGTRHTFSADEPLEMLYATIRVPAPG